MDVNTLTSVRSESPPSTLLVPWPPTPVYVELGRRFLGDRVTSYGGTLRFKVSEEGGEELPIEVLIKYPLVRIYAEQNLVLDYYEVYSDACVRLFFLKLHEDRTKNEHVRIIDKLNAVKVCIDKNG